MIKVHDTYYLACGMGNGFISTHSGSIQKEMLPSEYREHVTSDIKIHQYSSSEPQESDKKYGAEEQSLFVPSVQHILPQVSYLDVQRGHRRYVPQRRIRRTHT